VPGGRCDRWAVSGFQPAALAAPGPPKKNSPGVDYTSTPGHNALFFCPVWQIGGSSPQRQASPGFGPRHRSAAGWARVPVRLVSPSLVCSESQRPEAPEGVPRAFQVPPRSVLPPADDSPHRCPDQIGERNARPPRTEAPQVGLRPHEPHSDDGWPRWFVRGPYASSSSLLGQLLGHCAPSRHAVGTTVTWLQS
jgi:hypothetical protein